MTVSRVLDSEDPLAGVEGPTDAELAAIAAEEPQLVAQVAAVEVQLAAALAAPSRSRQLRARRARRRAAAVGMPPVALARRW